MKVKSKFKQVDIKIFLVPYLIITLIFFVISYFTITVIKTYYYNHLKENSMNLAKNYSRSITKGTKAYEVVNALLEEKILVASKTLTLYDGLHTNDLLTELAGILEVDEIDYYNSKGELILSNMVELIGWNAYKGHPVYDFMTGDNMSFIGEIRQDSITGNYYKYGYIKSSDGGFLQIGVNADNIHSFLDGFEMQQLLDEMQLDDIVSHICFIDNEFNIIRSTDIHLWVPEMVNDELKNVISDNREYGYINNLDGQRQYDVYVPVYLGDIKIGTLVTGQSLKETTDIIRKISLVGITTLFIIYSLLLYLLAAMYKKNKKLIQLAFYDSLTSLPNKQYLAELLSDELGKREETKKALMLINCIDFKIVNLTYGYRYGDELLKELSRNFQELLDNNKKLFRFTADRFIMYVKNYENQDDLIALTNKITQIYATPFKVKGAEQNLFVQIGIIEINRQYDNVDRLLKDVSVSMSNIKRNGIVNYAFFNEVMGNDLKREKTIEKEIRTSLSETNTKKIYLEYQPLVDLKTNQIIGFEALARMKTEVLGFVSPLEFISVAEKVQLIVPLGNMLLKMACEFIRTLNTNGYRDIKIAVNVSGIQLLRSDFIDTVMDILKETDILPSSLDLEITESVLLDNFETINEKLKKLKDLGIGISLDDFGTGYSSFSRLRDLNINILKIDREFISKIPLIQRNELITGDIISMAHKLSLTVVAEGVEIEAQKNYLIEHSCDIMQGYLFSKSLPIENALALLNATNTIERK